MRRYDDPVDVRAGLIAGQEAPAQFLWRDRLWVVREVIAHWIETGAWWEEPRVTAALFGDDRAREVAARGGAATDLLGEQEYWRVEARRGRRVDGGGVFELRHDTADGRWRLVGCID